MSKPTFVLISDIHFSINTLSLASASLRHALQKAQDLDIPLIVAGDTNDTKALLRAEVANELISIFKDVKVPTYVIVGNHDLIHEKGQAYSLEFLKPYVKVVDKLEMMPETNVYLLPYQSDSKDVEEFVKSIPKGSILVMHQGVKGAWLGDYVQDKTSVDPSIFEGIKVFSGHYHRHQVVTPSITISKVCQKTKAVTFTSNNDSITYVGNPYTLSFGEASDGPKGYLIINEDGTYSRVILDMLRKHIVIEQNINNLYKVEVNSDDLISIKIKGFQSELDKIDKEHISNTVLSGHKNFKLDLIPEDDISPSESPLISTPEDIVDDIIDTSSETDNQKSLLKQLWRSLL